MEVGFHKFSSMNNDNFLEVTMGSNGDGFVDGDVDIDEGLLGEDGDVFLYSGKGKGRDSNYTMDEDKVLCMAWESVTLNAIC
jgi:hypothetical protein